MSSGRLLARNSALNLAGQLLPAVLAIVAIPMLVRGLGESRFGVLTLAWAMIGYFGVFELGLGRALTQAVAQRLGNGRRDELAVISWTAIILLFVFGMVGGILLAVVTPLVVTRVLNVPADLSAETIHSFWILGAALPIVLVTVGLRGLMEAHQHFGLATALRMPLVVFTILGPVAVLPFSRSVAAACLVLAAGRLIGAVTHLWACLRRYPFLRQRIRFHGELTASLMRFGGWTTVSNVVSPLMVFMDRFVIGALLTVAAVTHYVTPYEVVVKLLIIPVSLITVMLPSFAATLASDPARMAQLYDKSARGILLATFPAVLLAVVFANEGLLLWLGPAWPSESVAVVQWLAIGVFATALAQPPLVALQGAGRPDLVAKLHVAELPFYVAALIGLTRAFGVRGVAIAWTLRAVIDCAALLWIARRTLGLPAFPRLGGGWPALLSLVALGAGALPGTTGARVAYAATVLGMFAPLGWFAMLTASERQGLAEWLRAPIRADAVPGEKTT